MTREPSPASRLAPRPGDASVVDRCCGPTLDVGPGLGRLTVALAERGIPALGIDATPRPAGQAPGGGQPGDAGHCAAEAGTLTLARDVFGWLPGTGRWMTVLLLDGSIGIGGDPVALLRRVAELLGPHGQALVELQPPGTPLRRERLPLPAAGELPWAWVGADQIADLAAAAGLAARESWSAGGRWFALLAIPDHCRLSCPMSVMWWGAVPGR